MADLAQATGPALPAGLRLRRASHDDLPGIMALEIAGFEPGIREEEAVFVERLGVFPNGFMVIEDARGALVAYLCSERWTHDEMPGAAEFAVGHSAQERHDVRGRVLYISSMTVAPTLRGQGLGRILFSASIEAIRASEEGIDRELLMVNETWHAARRIYESCGFAPVRFLAEFFEPLQKPRQGAWILARPAVATRPTPP